MRCGYTHSKKKFRGKKRYFKKIREKVETYHGIDITDLEWCDFWHTHLDFYGLGNRSVKVRREHIKAHIELYIKLLKQLENFNKPYQSWVWIDMEDAGDDAVYIHTQNPNHDNFPYQPVKIDWNCKIPYLFHGFIDSDQFNVGCCHFDYGKVYFIQLKFYGIPL